MTAADIYQALGVSGEVLAYGEKILETLCPRFAEIDARAEINQAKVLAAMQKNRVNATHFAASTGYGYDDEGRNVVGLHLIFCHVIHLFLGATPHKCVVGLQPIFSAGNAPNFLAIHKVCLRKLPFSDEKFLAESSPPIYAVLPETKKDPCIQSINDGRRGLGDNLYDQRNAVIFSENAKKPSLNMHSDWALECDISR